jgi:hypothetical protein
VEGQHFVRFFLHRPLQTLCLNFGEDAETVFVSILPHVRTQHLEISYINRAVVSYVSQAVFKLHIMFMGPYFEPNVVQDGFNALLEGKTGVKERLVEYRLLHCLPQVS